MLVYGLFRRVITWSWSRLQGDTDTDESDSNWLAASAHLQYGQNKSALAVAEDYGKNDTHTGEKMTRDTKLNWHHKLPETSQPCSPAGFYQYNLMSESLKHQQTSFLIFLKEDCPPRCSESPSQLQVWVSAGGEQKWWAESIETRGL